MSTTVTTPITEEKPFDAKAHFKARNEAEQAARTGKEPTKPAEVKTEPAKPTETKLPEDGHETHLPRSARREINRLREEAAEARGRAKTLEELIAKGAIVTPNGKTTEVKADEDPEPKRENFATDREFDRACGKWDARQEAKKEIGKVVTSDEQAAELEEVRAEIAQMDAKSKTDIAEIFGQEEWDRVEKKSLEAAAAAKEAIEAGEEPESPVPICDWSKHQTLYMLYVRSPERARIAYHFAVEPKDFQAMMDLTKTPDKQIAAFHRLEGRVERLYTAKEKKEAAQASEPPKGETKDRTHSADASAGRTQSERDALKPKPSAEVAARGGTVAPETPAIGSKEWMAMRNRMERAQ